MCVHFVYDENSMSRWKTVARTEKEEETNESSRGISHFVYNKRNRLQ